MTLFPRMAADPLAGSSRTDAYPWGAEIYRDAEQEFSETVKQYGYQEDDYGAVMAGLRSGNWRADHESWTRWGLTSCEAVICGPWQRRYRSEWCHNLVARFLDDLERVGGQAGYYRGSGNLLYFDVLRDAKKDNPEQAAKLAAFEKGWCL